MTSYLARKIGQTVLVLLIVTFISFLILALIPGDIASLMLGPDATVEQIEDLRTELKLDRPVLERYGIWLIDVLKGDFGDSIFYRMPVTEMLTSRIPVTFYLGSMAMCISVLFGITFGVIAAVNRGTKIDTLINVLANSGISIPPFWLGIVGIYVFALKFGWLPVQGYTPPGEDLLLSLKKAVMPCIIISLAPMASITRQTRSAMLEAVSQDYVRTARAKGLNKFVIIFKHILKNAIIPVITLIGMQVRSLVGGSVIAEQVFNIPGMGRLLVDAIFNRDFPVVQGCIVVTALVVTIANLLVDISYGLFDPRIKVK